MKYCIIHVNDRSQTNMNKNIKNLSSYEYINDILYFDGNSGNAWDFLNHLKIPLNVWSPYDGRSFEALPGEYGIWVSTINVLKYIVNNKIDKLLVLEDDIILKENFVPTLEKSVLELQNNFDFLSLYWFDGQNHIDERTDIGLEYIHKSLNQYSGAQAMLYSYSGASKILKAVKRKGIEYTSDCFIFKQSHLGILNGFSIKPTIEKVLIHDFKNIKSTIDPDNIRKTHEE